MCDCRNRLDFCDDLAHTVRVTAASEELSWQRLVLS